MASDPFVAEIRIFPFNFAPKGWAWCNGQLMPISQNTALFSLLGTIYGGDGKSTFALPNLMGCAPMHPDNGSYPLGGMGGSDTVTLLQSEIPVHSHTMQASALPADQPTPQGTLTAVPSADKLYAPVGATVQMAPEMLAPTGGSLPHNNLQPYLTFYFCIALQGVYPPRP